MSESSSKSEAPDDRKSDNEHQGTKVQRKKNRGRHAGSPKSPRPPVANVLSPERAKAVRKAERLLTMPRRETIERRRRAVNNVNPPLGIRRRPRGVKDHPAWLKGKGVDLTEWANAGLFRRWDRS